MRILIINPRILSADHLPSVLLLRAEEGQELYLLPAHQNLRFISLASIFKVYGTGLIPFSCLCTGRFLKTILFA